MVDKITSGLDWAGRFTTTLHLEPAPGLGPLMLAQGFYDPVNEKIFEPELTGISYSFTADGYFEEAHYRSLSNRASRETRELPDAR